MGRNMSVIVKKNEVFCSAVCEGYTTLSVNTTVYVLLISTPTCAHT